MGLVNFSETLFAPLGVHFSVEAQLFPAGVGDCFSVRCIDRTRGVEIFGADGINTIKPACKIQMAELLLNEIEPGDLDGGTIEFNSKTWRIENHQLEPTSNGENDGQVMLFLMESD